MRRFTTAAALVALAATTATAATAAGAQPARRFTLTSPDFKQSGRLTTKQVYNGFGCSGGNVSPALSWSNPPAGTKSFAVTVYDPDAPTGSGWWHWVIFNIPGTTNGLPEGAGDPAKRLAPPGSVQGNTDFGAPGYGGPCPPPGKPHRYVFTVYALKTPKIDVPANATAAMVGFNLNSNLLAKATLTALYGR